MKTKYRDSKGTLQGHQPWGGFFIPNQMFFVLRDPGEKAPS